MEKNIAIIGAGPAGLVASITAARIIGRGRVTLFESQDRVGKKILVTGNGRCNLSNANFAAECYKNPNFVQSVIERFGTKETLAMFSEMGLLTVQDAEGRIYPRTKQASSVLNCLRTEVARLDVSEKIGQRVDVIHGDAKGFVVNGQKFDKVVIACGGGSELAKQLGHKIVPFAPSLTAIITDRHNLVGLSGKRTDALVTLTDGKRTFSERGEVLFRDNGLSGIAVFNLSAKMAWNKGKWSILLNVIPELSEAELTADINRRDVAGRGADALEGLVDKFIARLAVKAVGCDGVALAKFLQAIPYQVQGVRAEGAQVTSGGVCVDEIGADMQSKIVPGVYFAGEAIDVDGLCGGYNLQWAWSSGHVAGEEACRD